MQWGEGTLNEISLDMKLARRLVPGALLILAAGASAPAMAQSVPTGTAPSAQFQYSAITGTDSVINATRVPVTNSKGKAAYWDMTITFKVSASGVPTLADVSIVRSPVLVVGSFKPGTYIASTDTHFSVAVSGPGVGQVGTTAWSMSSKSTLVCGLPSTAQWWTGPIADNPLAARIKAAKITSTNFAYGLVGTNADCWPFVPADLIGVSQVANTLTIADFTNNLGADKSIPQAQAVFTLSP
jgi:hypothetical protein